MKKDTIYWYICKFQRYVSFMWFLTFLKTFLIYSSHTCSSMNKSGSTHFSEKNAIYQCVIIVILLIPDITKYSYSKVNLQGHTSLFCPSYGVNVDAVEPLIVSSVDL